MKNIRATVTKTAIILAISLILLWLAEEISPASLFEPQSLGWVLWVSYARNLILPFVLYLLICLGERWLKTWQWRALLAFAIPALIEFYQNLYYRFSPRTYVGAFDPMDLVMDAIGVGLAVLVEQQVLAKQLRVWDRERSFATSSDEQRS